MAFLAGGAAAYVAGSRSITLDMGGGPHTVDPSIRSVGEAVDDGRAAPVRPARRAPAADSGQVAVHRARPRIPREGQLVRVSRTAARPTPGPYRGARLVERAGEDVRAAAYRIRTAPRQLRTEPVHEVLPARMTGAGHLNWTALARCESSGRPGAVDASGSYGGLYQLDAPTWQRLGGEGRPQDAPAAEQTYRAKRLYVQRGAAPWPACGRNLYR